MKTPLFIVGAPRSGTTFLASLLRFSSYGVPFESQFIIKQLDRLEQYGSLDDYRNFSALVKAIRRERAILQQLPDLDASEAFSAVPKKDYAALVDYVCTRIARKASPEGTSWGDKTPSYTLRIESLLELFPESRFIYITRDGRDVALSLLKKIWGPGSVRACAKLWKAYIAKKQALRGLEVDNRALFVKYEDLLQNTRTEIERVYEFLREECPVNQLKVMERETLRGNFDKWRSRMTPRQVRTFEQEAAGALRSEGYETTFEQGATNPLVVMGSGLAHGAKRIRHLLKLNLIDGLFIRYFGKEPFHE